VEAASLGGLKGVTSGQKGGGRCPKKSGKRG